MRQRYLHGIAVCYACDTDLIGHCAICNTGVCGDHIAENDLGVFLCAECKANMVAFVLQETSHWLRSHRMYCVADFRGVNDGIRLYGRSDEMLYDLLADLSLRTYRQVIQDEHPVRFYPLDRDE